MTVQRQGTILIFGKKEGKGIYNWTKKLRWLRIRGRHIAGTRGTC